MDCEKFEPLLLDELYEELDEVTSAAVKRHVSGCARCSSILAGMRSTRRLAVLPMLELPAGLEDRILASVKEAQKVVPIQSRASRLLSLAGSWAMRPQTAMAAVFLLMIGTSALVIRSRHSSERAAAVSVTEQGEPAAGQVVAPEGETASLDSKAAAAAHGPNQPAPITAPPVATASAATPAASAAVALNDRFGAAGPMDGITGGKGRPAKEDETSFGSALAAADGDKDQSQREKKKEEAQKRDDRAGLLDPNSAVAEERKNSVTRRSAPSDISNAGAPAGAPQQDYAPRGQSVAQTPATKTAADAQDGFSAGTAAYRTRNYVEATRQFDAAARSGDQNAALWAAKAVKDGNGGCGAAIPRFDAVAQKSSGSWIGNEAQLESARCQMALGQLDPARDKLSKLTHVPSHSQAAQQALNELNQVAQKREADRSKRGESTGGGAAAGRAAPAPVRAPAKPAATAAGF